MTTFIHGIWLKLLFNITSSQDKEHVLKKQLFCINHCEELIMATGISCFVTFERVVCFMCVCKQYIIKYVRVILPIDMHHIHRHRYVSTHTQTHRLCFHSILSNFIWTKHAYYDYSQWLNYQKLPHSHISELNIKVSLCLSE